MSNEYFDSDGYLVTDGQRARGSNINNPFEAIEEGFDLLPGEQDIKRGLINYAVDTGVANVYVVALTYEPTAFIDGMEVVFKTANVNTGASTINVNGLGVKTITKDGSALSGAEIRANGITYLRYNETTYNFEMR